MLTPTTLLLLLFQAAENNEIGGRTAIQKMMYFALSRMGKTYGFDYIPHYYGPYCPQLSTLMEYLVALGILEERAITTMTGRKLYSYYLTEEGKRFSSKLPKKYKKTFATIKKIADSIKDVRGDRIEIISCAAKVHYLLYSNKSKQLTIGTAVKGAESLGWKLTKDQIMSSATLLQEIYPSHR